MQAEERTHCFGLKNRLRCFKVLRLANLFKTKLMVEVTDQNRKYDNRKCNIFAIIVASGLLFYLIFSTKHCTQNQSVFILSKWATLTHILVYWNVSLSQWNLIKMLDTFTTSIICLCI